MASVGGRAGLAGAGPERGRARRGRAGPRRRGATLRERVLGLREGSIIVVTLVAAIYFSLNTSSFLTGENFKTLLPYFAPFAILAAGEVFVMILGEIDLSIGAMYLFAPFVFYKFTTAGIPLVPCVARSRCCAAWSVGAVNGFFVAIVGINSFVTTLGMLFAFEGLTLIISHGEPISIAAAQLHQTHVAGSPHRQRPQHRAHRIGQPPRDVRESLRRGHLLGADLGAGDRRDSAGRVDVHPLGPLHRRDRLEQARRRRRPGSG